MKTVPSLIASSTVGIAAAGLALGKPERSPPPRPSSKKRKAHEFADVVVHNQGTSTPQSRPATSSTVITPGSRPLGQPTSSSPNPPPSLQHRASSTRVEIPNSSSGRRLSILRHEEASSPRDHIEEDHRRESVSSRGSWMRRLSTIPNSYNNSPRSSIVAPESPSLTFSHGSAAPILSNPGSSPAQLPPNKLVKRATSGRAASGPTISRNGSKSQVPTLRRPATSHQRSVTLQQQFRDDSMVTTLPLHQTATTRVHATPSSKFSTPETRHAWRVYFEARPTKLTKERVSGRSSDGGLQNFLSTSRRIIPDETARPTLMKPEMINSSNADGTLYYDDSFGIDDDLDDVDETTVPTTESVEEPQKRARRSLSMHFSSPSSWISRSGSLRGKQRSTEGRSGGKRHASAPVSTMPSRNIATAHGSASYRHRTVMDPKLFQREPLSPTEDLSPHDPFSTSFPSRSRNSSSPLPPLSRLSSFNLDIARLGLSSSSSSAARRSPTSPMPLTNTNPTSVSSTGHPSPSSTTYFGSVQIKNSRTGEVADRASTLVESDNDTRGFISGDEDDMDFQSETVFDSLRSGATGSIRSHNPPLDHMFDESPPSLNGHAKSKRLSIHEMLANGGFQEASNRIVEEDEGMSTPVKNARSSQEDNFQTPVRTATMESDEAFPSSPLSFCLATKDFSRLSLDDDEEDEDWTKDDENMEVSNSLSPPNSSLNSRRVSPSFRAALADVTHSGNTNGNPVGGERPKSNLFDWSEPSSAEKIDLMGNSPRPRTAHVKQVADGRGGRAIGRKGPSALHIRSQSVPVVPDGASQRDHSKLTPKFGTWGLGAKGVSEEWDGDFEFDNDEGDNGEFGDSKMESSGMLVPPAIQASQASVAGHVGQIREVCLLVEDLKRLRLLAKEKNLLHGRSASLWKEAEGIIALAVPDEEDPTLSPPHSPASVVVEQEMEGDDFHEHGPASEEVSMPDTPIEVLNRHGKPTGFVYDGNTVRRRSVFSPEDDIFGAGVIQSPQTREYLRPPSNSPRHSLARSASDTARSVMETMHQHRSTSDPILQNLTGQPSDKMPFDTTSLKDLVNKASQLSRTLAEVIRKHDGSQSPEDNSRRDSSPAFTRVFTDPSVSPPKHLLRSHSNNSILGGSIDSSPTRSLGQRMHMMTVV
ncbi:uncharacterized protein LY89DRAFT_448886 [Mollisia scopiformis]|uniref:Uncharacterized protein n=1 Tax=Mollisia scopiformis TaxID=149040 RepID=A0A194XK94_MOLSC|nr:uncharacterized protein LY89DRAFT_448886 [Mollisia scopiformis]KUJ20630.1 hypothetical protein LY89DRAFT_448886 [Mollisia scopiformis]